MSDQVFLGAEADLNWLSRTRLHYANKSFDVAALMLAMYLSVSNSTWAGAEGVRPCIYEYVPKCS